MESGGVQNRRIRFMILLMGLILAASAASYAQSDSAGANEARPGTRSNFEVFSVRNLYISKSSVNDGSGTPAEQQRKLSVSLLEANLNFPARFREEKTVLVQGLTYQLLKFTPRETANGSRSPAYEALNRLDDLIALEYRFLVLNSFSDGKWRWWFATLHGLYSDRKGGLSVDDYRLQAALAIARSWPDGAIFGLGLAYSTTFSFPVLPVLTLQTSPQSALKLDLVLPFNGALTYRISENSEVGLAGRIEGNRYNLHGATIQNSAAIANNLRYSVGTIGPRAKLQLAGPCYLVVDAGRTFRRRLDLFNGNNKTGEIDLGNNWFTRLAFNLEF